jgi:hypothetical protein
LEKNQDKPIEGIIQEKRTIVYHVFSHDEDVILDKKVKTKNPKNYESNIITPVKVFGNRLSLADSLESYLGKDVVVDGQGNWFNLFSSAAFEYYEILLNLSCFR